MRQKKKSGAEKTTVKKITRTNVKERVPEKRVTGKQKKGEWIAGAGLLACMMGFLVRIPLGRMVGDAGVGFFAAAMELFTVLSVILTYGVSRSVAILVKYRMRREMYKSARKVFRNAMVLAVVTGTLVAGAVFFMSETIGTVAVLEHMSYMAVAAAAPAILLTAVIGVYRGYFQGIGTMIPTAHSRLLVRFMTLVLGLVFGSVLYGYGVKVANILKSEEYASAYGAMGAALGLSIACLLGVLHLIFIYVAYSGTLKQQLFKDNSKYVESNGQIISMLLTTALPYIFCALLYNINFLVDQRIFNYAVNVKSQGAGRAVYWGIYYGKYTAVAGIAAILCTMAGCSSIPRIAQAFERQEYREAQVRLERMVHHMAMTSIPCAVLLAVLAEPVAGLLFTGDIKTAVRLLQAGSAVVVLFSFTYLFMGILQRIRKMKAVIFGGLLAFIVHLAVLTALIFNTDMGIMAVMGSSIVFYLVTCATGFLGVRKYMKYSQEWIRTFAVTAIAAGVAGVIGMLLNKALFALAGSLITLFVCVPVCIIVYNVLIMVLRGVSRDEVEDMPGGWIFASIAERLHFL